MQTESMKIEKKRRIIMIKYSVKLQKTKTQTNYEWTWWEVIMMTKTLWIWARMNRNYKWLISLISKQIQTKPHFKPSRHWISFYSLTSFFSRERKSIHNKFRIRDLILNLSKALAQKRNSHYQFSCKSLNLKEGLKIMLGIKNFGINMRIM